MNAGPRFPRSLLRTAFAALLALAVLGAAAPKRPAATPKPSAPLSGRPAAQAAYHAAVADERARRFGDAERTFIAGEVADPHFADNFFGLAEMFVKRGNLIGADIQLHTLLGLDPKTPGANYRLGTVELAEHLYGQAAASFGAELQLRPKYKPAISGQEQAVALLQTDENQKGLAAATGVKSPARTSAPSTPQPKRTEPAARPQQPRAVVVQTPPPPPPSPAPSPAPQRLVAAAEHVELAPSTIADAEQYLLAAAADFDFTRALPKVTPPSDIATLKRELTLAAELKKPNADRLNELGTEALLVGRVDLARTAFGVAAKVNPSDWRSPYLAGLAAQIAGDGAAARLSYRESLTRNPRPEAYTSLAILDLADDHLDAAFVQANQAVKLDGGYEPGRFTAGMLALALQNVHAADENLTKAIALGQAPERTAFFLGAVKGAKPQASADITR